MSRYEQPKSHEVVLKRIRDIPSLPEVVNKIIQELGKPTANAASIAKLISYDPGLTSKVLRMVNSAAYGIQRQVSSIQHGIMILGFNTVRGLVLSASIFKLLDSVPANKRENQREFWKHSLATALATRIIAEALHMPDTDDAFSAAMLHDIGKMVLHAYFLKEYETVLEVARSKGLLLHGQAFLSLEEQIMGTNHTEVGVFLANKWKLPATMTEVITFHHDPEMAVSSKQLVYLVALANELSVQILEVKDFDPAVWRHPAQANLHLSDATLQHCIEKLQAELDSIEALLGSLSS